MRFLVLLAVALVTAPAAYADPFKVEDVAQVTPLPAAQPAPQTIAFTDFHADRLAEPVSGLIKFSDWAQAKPLQKQFLGLYPNYDEATITVGGKARKRRLHVFVAQARFQVKKVAASIDLTRYATLAFIERIDPAIKHRVIAADEAVPNKTAQPAANVDPGRRWCAAPGALCLQSHYELEGKLPAGVRLVNKLKESGRKIAEFIDFQSEVRVIPTAEIDQAALAQLTGIAGPITGVLEQNIFWVNQVMQFGKFLAVVQPYPGDPTRTMVSTFMALGVDSDLLEKKKEYGQVPVLRNLIPAQVLSGNSSFNTGNSISAGLPKYARNSIRAVAGLIEKE